jgi:aminoglycoside phosphotransferase (APT) family kinase protein
MTTLLPMGIPAQLLDASVVHAERAAWGFEHATFIVDLDDGRRVVLQQVRRPRLAVRRLANAMTVPPVLRAAGLQAPDILDHALDHDPPYIVRSYITGVTANTLLPDDATAPAVAHGMGAALTRMAGIDVSDSDLDHTWADPLRLASSARRWLTAVGGGLSDPTRVAAVIDGLPRAFAGRTAGFAHGDFCPVNGIVVGTQLVGMIDVDYSRVADPLFDAAWWSWVVGFHHPVRFQRLWPTFCAAAGITDDDGTRARLAQLQVLYLLERLALAHEHEPAASAEWCERLERTLTRLTRADGSVQLPAG